jgi:hypothetical protein
MPQAGVDGAPLALLRQSALGFGSRLRRRGPSARFCLVRFRYLSERAVLIGQVSPGRAIGGHDLDRALERLDGLAVHSLFLIRHAQVFPNGSVGLRCEIRAFAQVLDAGIELSCGLEAKPELCLDKKIPGREARRPLQVGFTNFSGGGNFLSNRSMDGSCA